MTELKVELCPETGICSILRETVGKADLMPDEVEQIREAGNDLAKIRSIVAAGDAAFAVSLTDADLRRIAADVG